MLKATGVCLLIMAIGLTFGGTSALLTGLVLAKIAFFAVGALVLIKYLRGGFNASD